MSIARPPVLAVGFIRGLPLALATPSHQAQPVVVPGRLRRAVVVVGDLLGLAAIALCIPFVIIAIGTPIALSIRLLLWMGGWL